MPVNIIFKQLPANCLRILLKEKLVQKISPTRAFNLVYSKTLCKECAKCARWLAIIARDYGVDDAKNTLKLML
jgi:hypothetical protein